MAESNREVIDGVVQRVAGRLSAIPGVSAIVLGGSWSRGGGDAISDLDLGIYYRAADLPSVGALRQAAAELDTGGSPPEVTDFGEWGPWVNGGAWLKVGQQKVDWLYREVERVSAVIDDCTAGRPTCDYYLGHPAYKQVAEAFTFRDAGRKLREAEDEGEVLRALKDL